MPEVRLQAVLPCIQPVCFHVKTSFTVLKKDIESLNVKRSEAELKTQRLADETAKLARQSEDIKEELAVLAQDKIRFDSELARVCALKTQTASQADDFEKNRFNSLQEKKKNALENAKNAQERFEEIRDRIRIAEENLVKEQGRKESVRNRRESLSAEMSELKIKSAELAKDYESSQRELETLKSGMTDTAENLGRLSEEEKKPGTDY